MHQNMKAAAWAENHAECGGGKKCAAKPAVRESSFRSGDRKHICAGMNGNTLPHLLPTLSVLLIMNAGWILTSNFEQFFLFSNMSNQTGMEVFDTYIYRYGMGMLNFSYATAVGMMKSVASIALLIFANSTSKAVSKRGIM